MNGPGDLCGDVLESFVSGLAAGLSGVTGKFVGAVPAFARIG